MKHVGILAHSPDGSALCYLTLIREAHQRFGGYGYGDVTLDYIPMGQSMPAWDAGDYQTIRRTLATSIDRLKAAGADFFICPDNTAHIALEESGPALSLPGLNIADVVAQQAMKASYRKVAILGTRYTMNGPSYPRALDARGIDHMVPNLSEQEQINEVIFDELCLGKFTDAARSAFVEIIDRLKQEGCDSVALVCTEIPLLITPEVSPLPTLDSTRLLASAAFEVTVAERGFPSWRGGTPSN